MVDCQLTGGLCQFLHAPVPPPSEGLDPALLIGIAAAGAVRSWCRGCVCLLCQGAASAPEVGATKPLLVQTVVSAGHEDLAAVDPSSLSVSRW